MTHAIARDDFISIRISAWMKERFPFANALLFFVLYMACAAVAKSLANQPVPLSLLDLVMCLVTWSFFLVIRIFDEHKDYELDVLNHPDRVLQSGLITLGHLKALAGAAIFTQGAFSLYLDGFVFGPVTFSWLLVFGYLCLMGAEFFCGEWLEKRLALYAFTHMLIMPLIVFWLANAAVQSHDIYQVLTPSVYVMMLLAFISGFCFEIARKTRGPEEERDTVDSYSKIFGTQGSAYVVMLLVSGMLVSQIALLLTLQVAYLPVFAAIMVLAYGFALKHLIQFVKAPSLQAREKNEAAIAINMLLGYVLVVISVLVTQGFVGSVF